MNLSKLFDMQRELDAKIIREKGLENMDRLPNLILALQVELGECANEWRGFKYWSEKQNPKHGYEPMIECNGCSGKGFWFNGERVLCQKCNRTGKVLNPLLEEYVDCLHFILSIGLILGFEIETAEAMKVNSREIISQFSVVFGQIELVSKYKDKFKYRGMWSLFLGLGEMLDFTWEQIEQAYISKNAVNHDRQANGY